MKLEKRSEGAVEPSLAPETPSATERKKPVIVYIMVLFIVAFLLMALSFLSHQRSNEKVIGSLQSSVSTLQELQNAKNETVRLMEELDALQDQLAAAQAQAEAAGDAQHQAESQSAALLALYTLQQQYAAQEFVACRQTIQDMEDKGQDALLSQEPVGQVIAPQQRYQQLKEAVMSQ